ncbi:MAG: hypothetical protein RQ715_11400 [Methylococcales bacterium]|nr:hypothetical protein [Methylococcales bacterium]
MYDKPHNKPSFPAIAELNVADWPEQRPIPLQHLGVPDAIRQAVAQFAAVAFHLHRIITDQGVEGWLLDDDGQLLEAFWLED